MGFLIGMDEAGYGPNLGPLVVAVTVWEVKEERGATQRVPGEEREGSKSDLEAGQQSAIPGTLRVPQSEIDSIDLYKLLRGIVTKSITGRRIAIADSKKLHQPKKGLRRLEHGLHTVLAAIEQPASSWSALVESCGADPDEHHAHLCWHTGFDCRLPLDVPTDEIADLAMQLRSRCEAAGARPVAIRARFVFPAQLAELSAEHGNKGAALSHVTVGLLREVMDAISNFPNSKTGLTSRPPAPNPQPPVFVVCDKHGGRNFYAALLQHHFPEHWIEPIHELREDSRYEWGQPESRVAVAFRMNGEQFLPTALASMTAKYLRELSMRAFNEFWCARVPGLQPTAGYPTDARRFKSQIEPLQKSLAIDDHILWRSK
jgi:ribonuclease HII